MKKDSNNKSIKTSNGHLQTSVPGLDDILGGGIPNDCYFLVQGDPGSGKTTLALQFLLDGVKKGEKGFYITLSETERELKRVAESHGWSLDGIAMVDLTAIDRAVRPEKETTIFHPSEMHLGKVVRLLLDEAHKAKPTRVVFDSLSEFRLIAETPLRYRRQLLNFKQEFAKFGSAVLLLDDKMDKAGAHIDPHILSLSHGVLEMEQTTPDYGATRRRLRIFKLRGASYCEGWHDYAIVTGGIQVFPRLIASEHRGPKESGSVSSGIAGMDALLGGGLDRGTTALIVGAAGTGKSTLGLQYAVQMARTGEKSLVFAFDETLGIMFSRAKSLGLDLRRYVDEGLIQAQQVDPAELSPGEFAIRVREGVDRGAKFVMVDSLNGYLNAMPGEEYLLAQLHELASYLNQRGVVSVLILAEHGLIAAPEAPVDLSYLADTVINMRYFEAGGHVKQAVSVIKKRSGIHEKTIREYRLVPEKGIEIGPPLVEFHGVLTGAPTFTGRSEQMMK